jgi:hypothetical protein
VSGPLSIVRTQGPPTLDRVNSGASSARADSLRQFHGSDDPQHRGLAREGRRWRNARRHGDSCGRFNQNQEARFGTFGLPRAILRLVLLQSDGRSQPSPSLRVPSLAGRPLAKGALALPLPSPSELALGGPRAKLFQSGGAVSATVYRLLRRKSTPHLGEINCAGFTLILRLVNEGFGRLQVAKVSCLQQ